MPLHGRLFTSIIFLTFSFLQNSAMFASFQYFWICSLSDVPNASTLSIRKFGHVNRCSFVSCSCSHNLHSIVTFSSSLPALFRCSFIMLWPEIAHMTTPVRARSSFSISRWIAGSMDLSQNLVFLCANFVPSKVSHSFCH